VRLDISLDIKRVKKKLRRVRDKAIDRAAVQALNKTIRSVQVIAVTEVSKETSLKPKRKVRQRMKIHRATRSTMTATLDATVGNPVNLIEFVAPSRRKVGAYRNRTKTGKFRHKGVRARRGRSGKIKVHKGTFIGKGKNSRKLLVFARQSRGGMNRKPKIVGIPGYQVKTGFIQKHIDRAMKKHAQKRWRIEFQRSITLQLAKVR